MRLSPTIARCCHTLLAAALLCPLVANAEGAVRVFDCRVTDVCDADAKCATANDTVVFRMEPQTVDAQGAGRYTLRYNDFAVDMEALSDAGPFHWRQASSRDTLLASSETRFLWHSLDLSAQPTASLRLLNCTLQQ